MSKKESRLEEIISYLKQNNGASVKDLAQMLNVSEMTIRRDLKILNSSGIVNNVYGSTIYNPNNISDNISDYYNLDVAVDNHREAKERIGKFAASLINADETIIIDAGSTTECLAKYINPSIKIKALCVTNNVLNILIQKKNVSIIFSGGYYHTNSQMFECAESITLINKIRANKVFISAAGVHEKLGITGSNDYEINTKKACIASGAERILLVDSSKFSSVKSAYFANLNDFDTIITDTNISPYWEDIIHSMGITLHKV